MELGGSDPFIVLPSANIAEAAKIGVKARLFGAGQVCIAAKRFIIDQRVYDKFIEKLLEEVKLF